MPKRPTPPSTNMLLQKKATSTKKATKKAKTKETKSIAPPSLPTPHESQAALNTSGGDMLKEASSLIVVGEYNVTGAGKTITLGHIMLNEAKKMVRAPSLSDNTVSATTRLTPRVRWQVADDYKVLIIGAFMSTEMVIEHAPAIGADADASPFTMVAPKMKKVQAMINAFGYCAVSVTTSYLRDHLIVGKKGKSKPVEPMLPTLVQNLGVTAVIIGLDEAHTMYDKAKFPDAIDKMRRDLESSLEIYVIPVTATPNLGRQACRANIMKLCGMDSVPEMLMYTDEQAAKFRLDNQFTPLAPTEATVTYDLGEPPSSDAGMKVKVQAVHDCLVNFFADMPPKSDETNDDEADEPDEPAIKEGNYGYRRLMLGNAVNSIVVKLAIGTDGGKLLDLATTGDFMAKRIGADKKPSGDAAPLKFEAVIIGAKTRAAEDEIKLILTGLADKNKDTENKIKVHDLRYDYNASAQSKRKQRALFKKDFNDQTGTVFGIIGQKQHASVNNLANIASTFAFIGESMETPLKQFFGRTSRPGSDLLKEGDFVPAIGYKAIHLKDEWAGAVMGIESPQERITRKNPAFSDDIATALNELKKLMVSVKMPHRSNDIELNTQKLILGDRLLKTDGKIVLDYIDAERAKYMPSEEDEEQGVEDDEEEGKEEDEEEGEEEDEEEDEEGDE